MRLIIVINHNSILSALKTVFDNDSTLRSLLGHKGDSKVFIGADLPDEFQRPAIQVVILTDNQPDTWHDLSELTFNINVHTQNIDSGETDMSESSSIINRCNALIDDQDLTVTNHLIYSMFVEGRNPAVSDPRAPQYSIEGIRCRMFAAA